MQPSATHTSNHRSPPLSGSNQIHRFIAGPLGIANIQYIDKTHKQTYEELGFSSIALVQAVWHCPQQQEL